MRALIGICSAFFLACGAAAGQPEDFVATAAQGGLAEIELGRIATTKAERDDVAAFAQRMMREHAQLNQRLIEIVTAAGIDMPVRLGPEMAARLEELRGTDGRSFDDIYLRAMVTTHEQQLAAYRAYAEDGEHPALRRFAAEMAPMFARHLEAARALRQPQAVAEGG